jgi:hypothetical protein
MVAALLAGELNALEQTLAQTGRVPVLPWPLDGVMLPADGHAS